MKSRLKLAEKGLGRESGPEKTHNREEIKKSTFSFDIMCSLAISAEGGVVVSKCRCVHVHLPTSASVGLPGLAFQTGLTQQKKKDN